MNRPDIVFIRAGIPDDLHPSTNDLSLGSMQQSHQLGHELKGRNLVPQRTYYFGSKLSQTTAEIITQAAGQSAAEVYPFGPLSQVERYPLQPAVTLKELSLSDWLDSELANLLVGCANHGFSLLLCVAPNLLISAVDRLTAQDRRCLTLIPHHEGFVCRYSQKRRHYELTEPIGPTVTYQLVLGHPPLWPEWFFITQ